MGNFRKFYIQASGHTTLVTKVCFFPFCPSIFEGPKSISMAHRHQDIPIRPRYGYVDEESGQERPATGGQATPASSYTEIPFLAQYPGPVPEHVLQDLTPTAAGNPLPRGQGNGASGESYVNLYSGDEEDAEDDDPGDEDNSNSNSNSKDSSGDPQGIRPKHESSKDFCPSPHNYFNPSFCRSSL